MLLCAISDRGGLDAAAFTERSLALIRAGVDLFQIREKNLSDREILALLEMLAPEAAGRGVRLLVNGRPDLAVVSGASGVHLPASGLPVRRVRDAYPRPFLIGRSCHSVSEVVEAETGGADYATFGPVFKTPSKSRFGKPLGLWPLTEASAAVKMPVLALGGISADRVAAAASSGAAGVAAIRLFWEMADPATGISKIRESMENAAQRGRK